MVYLSVDFVYHFLCEVDVFITALEYIFAVEIGVLVEHYLVHIELIKVGIQKRYYARG
jgi:hypothetical protein